MHQWSRTNTYRTELRSLVPAFLRINPSEEFSSVSLERVIGLGMFVVEMMKIGKKSVTGVTVCYGNLTSINHAQEMLFL